MNFRIRSRREEAIDMAFLTEFVWYLVKYIVYAVVVFAGIMLGKKLRDNKTKKER